MYDIESLTAEDIFNIQWSLLFHIQYFERRARLVKDTYRCSRYQNKATELRVLRQKIMQQEDEKVYKIYV